MLINRCFNIDSHIATICSTNINPSVPQCKNCWKWGHTIFAYHIYRAKCLKSNKPYKLENHRNMVWYCDKANFKTNLSRFETCLYLFKCIKCKINYQADSYNCLFWKYRFNHDWYSKKSQKLWKIRANLIYSSVKTMNLKNWHHIYSRTLLVHHPDHF